ncbi:MAG TPA: N-acetylmuramoyl-L-alanine amidase [Thermoanaerobaculia bacterium]|nr:N-acetylmuramoyl-L-alanine amidase [Thermoanaerobaculia bacterium]
MKDRRFLGLLALVSLLLPVLVTAQAQRAEPPSVPVAPRQPTVLLDGAVLPAPVTLAPTGPLFGLAALVNNLGGTLEADEAGESFTLTIEGKDVVIGVGSAIITVGDNIVSLSQPPTRGEGTLLVPLDFLQKTYGDLAGFAFEWRPGVQQLIISRRAAREIPVLLDVVHLQGMTTVVLQFPEAPRYQVLRQPGQVDVQMMGDRLAPPPAPPVVTDPLVQGVTISPEQVRIQLAAGAQASSYVLENPFRIVFDVHLPAQAPAPVAPGPAAPEQAPGVRTIVLDPGHGGSESGAIGPSGVQEKELTLTIARELEGRLESHLGVRVVLTRNEDATLPLDARTAIANQNKADLFISLHLNSSLGAGAHGAETYFLSAEASDANAARMAEAENTPEPALPEGTAGLEAQDLELILWDLAQTHHLLESQRFAAMIQGELNQTLQLRDRGVKQAPFRVLNGAAMPAVLVEVGFISNPDEEKKLQDAAYRAELVGSLTRAIGRYKALVENRPEPPQAGQPAQPAQPAPAQPSPGPAGATRPPQPRSPGRR